MNPFEEDLENIDTSVDLEYITLLREKREKRICCIKFIIGLCFTIVLCTLFLLFVLSFFSHSSFAFPNNSIEILSWNIQKFGTKKLNDPTKMEKIKEILLPFDIILLSELQQSECDWNDRCEMKMYFETNYPDYRFYMSPSLGRNQDNNVGKEQYGFLVKKKFSFFPGYYLDPNQIFSRPPYYIYIPELNLYLSNVHITQSPLSETKNEVIELYSFFQTIQGTMLLMGDLNLCNPSIIDSEKVRQNLNWILEDNKMTNLNNVKQRCPYDRIISNKSFLKYSEQRVIYDSNIIEYDLSDHYPIALTI